MSTWRERRIESAAIDVTTARDSAGLCVRLCDPLDVDDVRRAVARMAGWFGPSRVFLSPGGEYAAAQNLRKLVILLEAHLS